MNKILSVNIIPSPSLGPGPRVTIRGQKSGREIKIGGIVRAEDGDLVVTHVTVGERVPAIRVSIGRIIAPAIRVEV